jgi:hypothetical protein
VAIFGSIFNVQLTHRLATGVPVGAVGPCAPRALSRTSAGIGACPAAVQTWYIDAYVHAIHTIFLAAVPIGGLALVLAWFIPEVKLRGAANRPEIGEAFALPSSRTSLEELRVMLWRSIGREDRLRAYGALASMMGVDLTPGQTWMVSRVAADGTRTIDAMAQTSHTPAVTVERVAAGLQDKGLATVADGTVTVTDAGRAVAHTLRDTERTSLRRLIDEWPGAEEPDVDDLLEEIIGRLSREDQPSVGVRG